MPTKYKTNGMHNGEVTTERKQNTETRSWFSSVALSNVHSTAKPRLIQRAYSTLSFGGSDSGTVVAGREITPESETSKTAASKCAPYCRRGLTAAPTFGPREEASVRLLSLQHNAITRLDGLPALPRLVFLDLYDNQLERLVGIGVLPNLRVLLIGKNRPGFQDLLRLEVLDLHGNRLTKLGRGLEALSELKVLNVAGNQLRGVSNHELQGLVRLQELNLRRNQLQQVDALSKVSSLKKLFLSNNNIQRFKPLIVQTIGDLVNQRQWFDSMVELMNTSSSCGLLELSIDGNSLSIDGNSVSDLPECAPTLVTTFPHLRFLNGTEVTPQLRAAYVLRSSEASIRQPQVCDVRMM
ncbi:hypothetical protein B566_EDAN012380 [Ephemera danica]|nr:hypothetical protein B566_EDAN012380 [Ephemera danica]